MGRLNIDEFVKGVVEKLQTDENYREIFKSKVDTIRLVNALVFSDLDESISNNYYEIVKGKDTKTRSIKLPTKLVVGYNIENIGDEDIIIPSTKWTKNEDAEYVSEPEEILIHSGETISLTKKDFFMLIIKPEYSNEFANGLVTTELSIADMANMKFEDIINLMEISLRVDENGDVPNIDFDRFMINISTQNTQGTCMVKSEYEDRFGFLNNEK